MDQLYKMPFDTGFYDELSRIITDYECGNEKPDELYYTLVAIQNEMAEQMN